ncbi:PA14 domain-containing protein [Amycolatopsis thermalba]|uniref:PA14 domain-containing protein n=1 Tax=Amycolatopsis thermalba TaxID=944492 RepID=A0ABY4NTP2_9PSEU|nr:MULTISPECIES: PA14 domain-containing protein [Amycolatopsis]UQS23446.1 PA14 domain-containing protein [Amycolatopsis thermalba]
MWSPLAGAAAGIPVDHNSLRATGDILFPQAGNYTLRVLANDGVRVWIDEQLIIDDWRNTAAVWRQATVNSPAAGAAKRIRIDYYEFDNNAQLELHWTTPSGVQQAVPGSQLKPRYGLTTSTVTDESDGVPNKTESTQYAATGLDPVYSAPAGTTTDPSGLALTSRSGYEAVGTGYLRTTSKSMPSGATTTYAFYGDTETRANPCVPGSPAINQGGMAKLTTGPAPLSGNPRVDEQVYDASGRTIAKATGGEWSCTTYDARDRVVQQTHPANATAGARTVTTNYAVGGDPLTTSITDEFGVVTTTVDLLGRVVAYTDVHGTRTETTYDQAGRSVQVKVVPPADPAQISVMTYDDANRLLTLTLAGTTLATASYDAAGELKSVAYSNGSALTAIGKDPAGRATSLTWATSDGAQIVSQVGRTRSGTIIDEALGGVDPRPNAPNYLYDAAGRLTQAWVAGHHYTYDFTSPAPAACPTGTQANAGLNTNRVRLLDETSSGTVETGYCYDAADRILATTGANPITSITYDNRGNTTAFTNGGSTTYLGWDTADRHLTARTTGADPADVAYVRDATDRITRRGATQGDDVTDVLYSYTGDGDSADLALDAAKKLLTRSISLPGGVLYTLRNDTTPTTTTWGHPTIRGDLSLTTNATGAKVGDLRTYTPFGEPLTAVGAVDNDNVPDNQAGQLDYGWLGQHQRPYEHAGALAIVQMGSRPYLPALGRFLSVDPVEDGSANDYDYVAGDPVNATDLDGHARYRAKSRWYRYKYSWRYSYKKSWRWAKPRYSRKYVVTRASYKASYKYCSRVGRPGRTKYNCGHHLSCPYGPGSGSTRKYNPIPMSVVKKVVSGCLFGGGPGGYTSAKWLLRNAARAAKAGGPIGFIVGCGIGIWASY